MNITPHFFVDKIFQNPLFFSNICVTHTHTHTHLPESKPAHPLLVFFSAKEVIFSLIRIARDSSLRSAAFYNDDRTARESSSSGDTRTEVFGRQYRRRHFCYPQCPSFRRSRAEEESQTINNKHFNPNYY